MLAIDQYLQDLVKQTVAGLPLPGSIDASSIAMTLDRPANPTFGDYSSNVAMTLFSQLSAAEVSEAPAWLKNPRVLADHIAQALQAAPDYDAHKLSQVTVAGPGFINFTVAPEYLLEVTTTLAQAQTPAELLTQTGQGHQVVVEYSSPNIAKPFTVGHLRSTIVGDAVANILEATGWTVFRDNHLGDWGTQFGKQIYAIKTWGNEAELEMAEHPVKKLVELYVKFHEAAETDPQFEDQGRAWFKKLESGDPEARRLWEKCIAWSLKEFQRVYQQLGVSFTENQGHGYGESFFEDKMSGVIEELTAKGLLKAGEEGARLIFFPDDEFPPMMLLKKDGATLYATRDLATDKWRLQHYGQEIVVINEVGAEQSTYFKQLYRVEELAGWYQPGQRIHVKHGMYRFADQKMSTRKGNVIWLEDVLAEAEKRAATLSQEKKELQGTQAEPVIAENAAKIGIAALKWNDLKRSSHLDVVFDWDEIINLKGNSGPYLLYTYVRAQSILAKAPKTDLQTHITIPIDTVKYSFHKTETNLMRELSHFDETVQLAAREFAPHYISTYLYQLAQSFNTFYTECSVLGEGVTPEQRQVRLQLTQATGQVLKAGLGLLGIETVEKM